MSELRLGNFKIEGTNSLKYLGLYFSSGNDLINDISLIKRTFYSACNCLYANSHNQNELIQPQLKESYCLPVLTSCTAAVRSSTKNINQLNTCWNSLYRRIFSFHRWESVRTFINGLWEDLTFNTCAICNQLSFTDLCYTRKLFGLSILYEGLMRVDVNFAAISPTTNSNLLRPSWVRRQIIVSLSDSTCI